MKNQSIVTSLIFLFFISFTTFSQAGELVHTLTFDKSQLRVQEFRNYHQIILPGCELTIQTGAPQLPVKAVQLALPPGARVESIQLVHSKSALLDDRYQVLPVQAPQILSRTAQTEIPFTEPDLAIYQAEQPYPESILQAAGQGRLGEVTLANVLVYPLQYLPATNQLRFYEEITFQVNYQTGTAPKTTHPAVSKTLRSLAEKLTANPVDGQSGAEFESAPTTLEPGYYPYVIITREDYVDNFQPLADWKKHKGLPTKIITTNWLIVNYRPAPDNIVRTRNFLKDAVEQWGTIWVLIGGDTNVIPVQKCWAMNCKIGDFADNFIPCDLYVADLDGDWNANANQIYGEVDDQVDLYPDVFVGRAPAENETEIDAFVKKVLVYEKNPDHDYVLELLFAADLLWEVPYTDTGVGQDRIHEKYIPPRFNVTKLYHSKGNESRQSVIQAINQGKNIINHDGHAWWSVMSTGEGGLSISDMDRLNNTGKYSLMLSIGCWPAAIDYDCIAEHFVTNPRGGGVAFIGNSRYGWGAPGNPGLGYSDRFIDAFFHYLFIENVYQVGQTLALAKAKYVPYSQQENVYRWCMYQVNLLGDPEMPLWTDLPESLQVHFPELIPAEGSLVNITVKAHQQPLANARVCLMNDADVYLVGTTDFSGQVQFNVATETPSKKLDLTVTAQNCLPYQSQIAFQAEQPFVAVEKVFINDQNSAFPDSMVTPGETVQLSVQLKNFGQLAASGINITVRTSDPRITITDSAKAIDQLNGGAHILLENAFSLIFDDTFVNGDAVNLECTIAATETTWTDIIGLTVATPLVKPIHILTTDSLSGNQNDYAEVGETVQAFCQLENQGLTTAQNLQVWAETLDKCLAISNKEIALNGANLLAPGEKLIVNGFDIEVIGETPNWPAPYFPIIRVHIESDNGPAIVDSFQLVVGKTGLWDDLENGAAEWTHQGKFDFWHLDSVRAHSGQFSWYCGNPETRTYPTLMNAELFSPPFYLAPASQLSFWAWFDVAPYSAWGYEGDGMHVEIKIDNKWEQLDFIGTGGALNSALMGNDWLPYYYDLSEFPTGIQTQVRFRFVNDNDQPPYPGVFDDAPYEGMYVDDIAVTVPETFEAEAPADTFTTPIADTPPQPTAFRLTQNYPNPFNPTTSIRYSLARESAQVKLVIYNLRGQQVRTLVQTAQPAGDYVIQWDGCDEQGVLLSSGVYFYQLTTADFQLTHKMILMR